MFYLLYMVTNQIYKVKSHYTYYFIYFKEKNYGLTLKKIIKILTHKHDLHIFQFFL
jgi:hypothetical protein